MAPRSVVVAISLMTLLVAATGSPAQEAPPTPWSAPDVVAPAALRGLVAGPALTFGASGRGLVSWDNEIGSTAVIGQRAVARRLDGSFGRESTVRSWIDAPLSYGSDRLFALAQPASVRSRAVQVMFGSLGAGFGAKRTIYVDDRDTSSARTAAAASQRGDVAVAHLLIRNDFSRRVVLLERSPGRPFGAATVVAERPACPENGCHGGRGEDPADALAVAVGHGGDIVVAWEEGPWVKARVRRAGEPFGPVVRVGPGYGVDELRAAISSRGAVWVGWTTHPFDSDGYGTLAVRVAVRPAAARAFAPPRILERIRRVFDVKTTGVTLDPGGAGFLAWSYHGSGHGPVRLALLDARGRVLGVQTVSTPGADATVGALAASRRPGEALLAWTERSPEESAIRVVAGLAEPAGVFDGPAAVSDANALATPAAAFDPRTGAAIVVWLSKLGAQPQRGELDRVGVLAATRPANR